MQLTIEQYEKIQPTVSVHHHGSDMRFTVPNRMTHWRVETLFKKEPDTVAWLSEIPRGSILLDVGANMGLYTVFAAVTRGCEVIAFEPESQNYALLNRNIHLNGLSGRVKAYCAAIMDQIRLDSLYLSAFDFHGGGSCHSFGAEVGFDLRQRRSPFAQGCVSIDLDQAVENGMVPVPGYIKIDVDGFEHKVIAGASRTLADPRVRELLIEVNPHLPEHQAMLAFLAELGFTYDEAQFRRAARAEGAFEGVGEIIFRRRAAQVVQVQHTHRPDVLDLQGPVDDDGPWAHVVDHILERIAATPVQAAPFPHAVVDKVFPDDYYQALQHHFPQDGQMTPLSETGRTIGYDERLVSLFSQAHFERLTEAQRTFWRQTAQWLYSPRFMQGVIDRLAPFVEERIARLADAQGVLRVHGDALLVSDKTRYAIGPHTDAAHRLVTFLFYLPQDDSHAALGTSLFEPKDPGFRCAGGPHYDFAPFNKVKTVGFLPNRLLLFPRTDSSFHGVEEIQREQVARHLLINNIRIAG